MKQTVSIIIPIFNAMPYLEECLQSICCQKSADLEVLLINNGSTDDSFDCCRSYADRYPFIRAYDIDSASIGEARNYGLKVATGEYIMFIDADDLLPDAFVVKDILKKLSSKAGDICVGNFSRLWGKRLLHATSHRSFSRYPQDSGKFLFTGFFSVDILSYVWAKLYKKSFLTDNGIVFTNSRYAEDKLFNLQCSAAGAKYAFLNREVYVHRNTPYSVSNSYRVHSHMIWIDIAKKLESFLEARGEIPRTWQNIIAYTIFFGCFFDCKMEYRHCNNETGGMIRLLKDYAEDPMTKKNFDLLSKHKNVNLIPSVLYRIMISGFAKCMRYRMYRVISLGIKILVDFKIDERLSDTGKKPKKL
ncbi:MAG: glycosyltransferase family 2 protein [Lachnospiraceae bacterium]|nr:glycosyltransferase family 2 protein [Lachnospiraceae bacterium]